MVSRRQRSEFLFLQDIRSYSNYNQEVYLDKVNDLELTNNSPSLSAYWPFSQGPNISKAWWHAPRLTPPTIYYDSSPLRPPKGRPIAPRAFSYTARTVNEVMHTEGHLNYPVIRVFNLGFQQISFSNQRGISVPEPRPKINQ